MERNILIRQLSAAVMGIACAMSASAVVPQQSFCAGYGLDGASAFSQVNSKAHVAAAARLDASQINGSELVAVKFYMGYAADVRDCLVFFTDDLSTEGRIYEQEFTPAEGWNYVWLDWPMDITEYSNVYVGYELTCQGEPFGMAEGASDDSFLRTGSGAWTNPDGAQLCLAGVFTGGDYSAVEPTGIKFSPMPLPSIAGLDTPLLLEVTLTNTGINRLDHCTWSYTVDGIGGEATDNDFVMALCNYGTADLKLPVVIPQEAGVGNHAVAVTIESDPGDRVTYSFTVDAYEKVYPHYPLVEVFTSQLCSNCPEGEEVLERSLAYSHSNAVKISHHAGFRPDAFSIAASDTIAAACGVGTNPAMMLNRATAPGQSSAVSHPALTSKEQFASLNHVNTLIGVDLDPVYYLPDDILQVKVAMGRDAHSSAADVRLHVALCESGMVSWQYASGTTYSEYEQNDVPRAWLTPAVDGMAVEFGPDGEAAATLSLHMGEASGVTVASRDNLTMVAFLTEGDTGEVLNCMSEPVALSDEVAIDHITSDASSLLVEGRRVTATSSEAAVYTLDGRLLERIPALQSIELPAGIYVVSTSDATTCKLVIR